MIETEYIKLKNNHHSIELLVNEPKCFLLLAYIAIKAKKVVFRGVERLYSDVSYKCIPHTKTRGGLTLQNYRTCLKKLCKKGIIAISKNKKKEIFLLENEIWEITLSNKSPCEVEEDILD